MTGQVDRRPSPRPDRASTPAPETHIPTAFDIAEAAALAEEARIEAARKRQRRTLTLVLVMIGTLVLLAAVSFAAGWQTDL